MTNLLLVIAEMINLKVEDSLPALFVVALVVVGFIPIKKLSDRNKSTLLIVLGVGLCLTIANSAGLRIAELFANKS